MPSIFSRRSARDRSRDGRTPKDAGERLKGMSAAETARFCRIAEQFAVPGPFTDPDEDDRELWRAGKLVPWYISTLLDHGSHVGPQVDLACRVQEPDVDRWEAGHLYPMWENRRARQASQRPGTRSHPPRGDSSPSRRPSGAPTTWAGDPVFRARCGRRGHLTAEGPPETTEPQAGCRSRHGVRNAPQEDT